MSILLAVMISMMVPEASEPSIALMPCDREAGASVRIATRMDRKLQDELKRRADLIPRSRVLSAMEKLSIGSGTECDDACMARLGKELGADRVVRQSFFMQDKEQSKGVVWIWRIHQVLTATGEEYGHFERMCMCSLAIWDFIAKQHARKIVEFDPSKQLVRDDLPEAFPTEGPVKVEGMVYVPAGDFIMGSELGEFDEEPRHEVYLDAFYIDKYETTNEEYQHCVDAGKCKRQTAAKFPEMMGPRQPVVGVGWWDAVDYCEFAGKRLPTEAEWEKAARGTDERRYPWGNEWLPDQVNTHHADDGFETTAPVGSFPRNVSPYGAYDMAGNAWEWVWDFHDRHYYERSERRNPRGPEGKERDRHSMRGGSWMYDVPFFMTTFNRSPGRPYIRKRYVGFRCAMDVPQPGR